MNYKFTIVMAVYNVEPFLRDAVESLEQQTIGFENIQLILVNDGSTDGSAELCNQYAEKYPKNVLALHQANAGVSAARNRGLEQAQGEYVNFLDSDDKLTPDTLKDVYAFFSEHKDEVDVVSIPMIFFDATTGEHLLNYKFARGSRVIDLSADCTAIQLSMSSAFVKRELLLQERFDTRLSYAEDAKLMQKILLRRFKLGVVSTGKYLYRKRSTGSGSAIQTSTRKKGWYNPCIKYFTQATIEYCLNYVSYVPRFIQYALMYDLQWRVKLAQIPANVLTETEKKEYLACLQAVLSKIDDDIIMLQRQLSVPYKLGALALKYQGPPNLIRLENDIYLRYGNTIADRFSKHKIYLDFISMASDRCKLEGRLTLPLVDNLQPQIYVCLDGKRYPAIIVQKKCGTFSLGKPQEETCYFCTELPLAITPSRHIAAFGFCVGETTISSAAIEFGKFFPLVKAFAYSVFIDKGWCVGRDAETLCFEKASKKVVLKKRIHQYLDLWKKRSMETRKAVFVRVLCSCIKRVYKKPIWLVTDRTSRADDNGETFFRYLIENHRKEIKAYFVLSAESPDYERIKAIGPVLEHLSHKHKLMLLISDCVVSSQAEADMANPFGPYGTAYKDLLANIPFVFLQHGVTKDDLSGWLRRDNKNLSGFVTTARAEYDSILRYSYGYSPEQVWLTGFPRFDYLQSDPQKIITVMPTWRRYLFTSRNFETDIWSLAPNFAQSEFYQFYYGLFHSERLRQAVKQYGYTLQFFPHPNVLPYVALFELPQDVPTLPADTRYHKIYKESSLIVTDYSSAVFDFAYLYKPILYTQFDAETFFSGAHSYNKGYFDYERDGFGEVEYDLERTVDRMIEYMQNGCQLKDKYRKRIDDFFAFHDRNNCQRVYRKIAELTKE